MTDIPEPGDEITIAVNGTPTVATVESVELNIRPVSGTMVRISTYKTGEVKLPREVFDDD